MNAIPENITKEIAEIKARNLRVEADKAWERSRTRILSITAITYVVAALVLKLIGTANYLLGALIPALGYFLSTQSLPFLKRWWIYFYLKKHRP